MHDYFVDIFLTKAFLSKNFEGEMFIRILPTTLLQIFCKNLLYFQVIYKSMKIADNTFPGSVNGLMVSVVICLAGLRRPMWRSWRRGSSSRASSRSRSA